MSPGVGSSLDGRSVLVTGHTGFKGSWLCLWLHRLGARVTGFALEPPTDPANFAVSRVEDVLDAHVVADIRDRAALRQTFDASTPDVVLHLAAQSVVRESYDDPVETFDVNVMGTVALLEAVRAGGRPCGVVVVTSDKCYENDESGRPLAEDDPMGGADPYSASKGAAELVTSAYRRSFFPPASLAEHGVAVATARAGNVIGGGDWTKDGLVADAMRALLADRPVPVRNPGATRPWQHVLEPLSGYLTLAERLIGPDPGPFCRGWNFGPDAADDAPVAELIDRLLRAWGSGTWEDRSRPGEPHEAGTLRLSNALARAELGWRPRWGLDRAVERTAAWFARYRGDPAASRAACLEDIEAYESAAVTALLE